MKISLEKLGRNIRRERERLGMSVEEMARRAGESVDSMIKAEEGRKRITLATALSLCHALEITPNELLRDIRE